MRKRLLSLIISMILVVACFAPTVNAEPTGGVDGFVERLYTIALNRASEPEGKAFWIQQLKNKEMTGAEVAHGFFFSKELVDSGISDEEYVKRLYETFMDREPENEGFSFWTDGLSNKTLTRESVFIGFVDSAEWVGICDDFGIISGGRSSYRAFIDILYKAALGREADEDGANYWIDLLRSNRISGIDVAREFFFSKEFISMNIDNEGFVKKCYSLFLNREPDEEGLAYWKGLLDSGKTRGDLFNGFAYSDEYWDVCKNYGIRASFEARPSSGTAKTVDLDQLAKEYGYEILDIDMGNGKTQRIYGYYIDMSELDSMVNDYRESIGLPKLPTDKNHIEEMKLRAAEITLPGYFSHQRPNGSWGTEANIVSGTEASSCYSLLYNSAGHRATWEDEYATTLYSVGFRRMIFDESSGTWSAGSEVTVQYTDYKF